MGIKEMGRGEVGLNDILLVCYR